MNYIKNVVTLKLEPDLCTGCGLCTEVCPRSVLELDPAQGKVDLINRDSCIECGACMMNCPIGAISVQAGVGCAYALLKSRIQGKEKISCDCDCS